MQIPAYGIAAQNARRADQLFGNIKDTLNTYGTQLSTGKVASTYGGYGGNASTAIYLDQRLAALDGYSSNITAAQTRVALAAVGLQQLSTLSSSFGITLDSSSTATNTASRTASLQTAAGNLAEGIDSLNVDVNGSYIFSGRTSDTQPVVSLDLMMNGDSTHAGLKDLAAQRKAADLGAAGLGRLTLGTTGGTLSLAEEAGQPFGFKLSSVSATGSAIGATLSAGPPKSAGVTMTTQPVAGDTVVFNLTLPDGTSTALTLTAAAAGASGGAASNTFAIGATPADTLANLQTALQSAVSTSATTTLAAASTYKTSTDFFNASTSSPPVRVDGPPYDTATATVAGTADNTVIWYAGDDGAGSARETAPVRVGESQVLAVGLRANETPIRTLLAGYAALSADTFDSADSTAQARFTALSQKIAADFQSANGTDGVNNITTDMSNAKVALGNAADRVSATSNQVHAALDPITTVSTLDVTQKLVETQTRLQASYQVTAALGKLSLTDYLS